MGRLDPSILDAQEISLRRLGARTGNSDLSRGNSLALVTLRSYRDSIDAELAKTQLESAGIPAIIVDQYLVSIQWLYSGAIGGVKVKVDESNLEIAREVLRENRSADLSSIPESQTPLADGDRCPVCGSSEIETSRLQRNMAAISLAIGVPLIAWRHRWICKACNHSWKRRPTDRVDVPPETLEAEQQVYEHQSYPRAIFALLVGLSVLYYVWVQIHSSK
jgi:transposase-like protein